MNGFFYKMPRLIAAFLRHGEYQQLPGVPSAMQPFALNEKGLKQAYQVASNILSDCQQMQAIIHSEINSSALLRAWQTAQQLRAGLLAELGKITSVEFSINQSEKLTERSVGCVANLNITQIENILTADPRYSCPPKNWKSDSYYSLPFQGAESLMDAGLRVAQFIAQKMQQLKSRICQDTIMIFVGHGAAFRHAAYHLSVLEYEQIAQLSMFHAQPIYIELKQQGQFQHIFGKWKVRNYQQQQYID
ncbi:MAG: histidine phosphatase family protein [Pseudomonadota bacterium]